MKLQKTELDRITERLSKESSICAAFLHGSAAKDVMRPDSDVDIAVLPQPAAQMTTCDRLQLADELESVLGRKVDIGILSSHNLIYTKEVIENGKLLFTKNSFLSERFFSTCLSMYADLQQDRKEVLYAYSA